MLTCEVDRIGHHGYQGLLYRLKDISLAIEEPKLQQSYVLKVGEVTIEGVDIIKEPKFHFLIGSLYENPCIPQLYLASYLDDHPLKIGGYWAMLMEDIEWGDTKSADSGFSIEYI